ncbi:MAG: IS630 family transposase [Acidimicrobiales bacterium]
MRIGVLVLRDGDREELERRAVSRTYGVRDVQRAGLILAAADGVSNREIGRQIGMHYNQVAVWRRRYEEFGLAGLVDEERSGRPVIYGHDDVLRLVKTVTEPPPDSATRWTMDALADRMAEHGVPISASQVWRICQALDLKPWQTESWMTSHDPDFWEKAGDVCALYLDPPENVMVWSVDEKTGIQAKSRINPTRPAVPAGDVEADAARGKPPRGRPVRQEFEYKRNGTAMLFAALDVHGGGVAGWVADSSRSDNFVLFLQDLIAQTPTGLDLHCICDNLSAHKSKIVTDFLERPENSHVHLHFTPTHASWLNQVELFFSIMQRRLLSRGEFTSVEDLADKIIAFINDYNRRAKPFKWTYAGRPLQVA